MRIFGIVAVAAMVGLAAFQSIVGGAPEGEAARRIALTEADICTVEAMTLPVIRRETRTVETAPAHTLLEVTPAVYGSRTDDLVLRPEHREGATFFIERKRVIVSEATRRLRPVAPIFEAVQPVPALAMRPRVEGGKLVEETVALAPPPSTILLVREARIEAVRVNAGMQMREIEVIDADGDGAPVPAKTVPVEVRTVEAHPSVASTAVPATSESFEIETVERPAEAVEAIAVCTIAGHPSLVDKVRATLVEKGAEPGVEGAWSAKTIDAMAAAQSEETGLVSPFLLVRTLREWLPDVDLPPVS